MKTPLSAGVWQAWSRQDATGQFCNCKKSGKTILARIQVLKRIADVKNKYFRESPGISGW